MRARVVAIAMAVALLVTGGTWWAVAVAARTSVTAYFGATVGLFPGSDVRVLGMRVGSVTEVVPEGTEVRVEMRIDDGTPIPAEAKAVAVAPSLVSDRYVQFTPVHEGGPELADGAVIPRERTATPLELDEINRNTDRTMRMLGPDGANRDGALSDFLDVQAANLGGHGAQLNDMLRQLGKATSTLSGSKEDLFATVDDLQLFNRTLADNDQQVHRFNSQLADTAGFLASERGELGAALRELGPALSDTAGFIRDNRAVLRTNVDHLRAVTQVLVEQRAALEEVTDLAPLGLSNLANTYDASAGVTRTRGNINELTHPPIVIVCKLLRQSPPDRPVPPVLADACNRIEPVVTGAIPLPSPAEALSSLEHGNAPDIPLPLVDAMRDTGSPYPGGGR
ncbi:MCE family protein [Saccharopolyspora dendranthemae]|uniref:Virulence factor Mce-like protein n=1 Tax=Saccharopolyspora dendranthemae TaxID=1181886 RepID=A0A561U7F9_9PSEU|nr:MCE family protein [Saccharopolyspora dendranthemae]TWF95299.1 virulence factor Mce-like protein [Saccharopolyspora dendranthemae]